LAVLRTPLAAVLEPINSESNNAVADQLFFALGLAHGGEASRAGAGGAVRAALERLGLGGEAPVQIDGSGLSRQDRISARQLCVLLRGVLGGGERAAGLFRDSLALAGRRGSLASRMGGTPAEGRVRAKTGWIRGTSALSGTVLTLAGERLCFSILVEYPPAVSGLNTHCWKPLGDRICVELVGFEDPGEARR